MRNWAIVLISTGIVAIILNELALKVVFPTQWGGPNLGAGLINLISGVAVVVGVILLTVATIENRGSK